MTRVWVCLVARSHWLRTHTCLHALLRSWIAATKLHTHDFRRTTGAPSFVRLPLATAPPAGGCPRWSWRGAFRFFYSHRCTPCHYHATLTGAALQFSSTLLKTTSCGTLKPGGGVYADLGIISTALHPTQPCAEPLVVQPCACCPIPGCGEVASWHRGLDSARSHAQSRT